MYELIQDFLTSLIAWGLVTGFLLWFGRNWIGSYISEKGKNLATREDIEDITRKIESVKTEYTNQTELLKSHLTFLTHTQTFAYQEEFKAFKIIWKRLIQFRKSTLGLRPVLDYGSFDEDEQAKEKQRRLERFDADRLKLAEAIEFYKPFYPEHIFTELDNLLKVAVTEAVGYKHGKREDFKKYWDTAEKNREEMLKGIASVCDLIRDRIDRTVKRLMANGIPSQEAFGTPIIKHGPPNE